MPSSLLLDRSLISQLASLTLLLDSLWPFLTDTATLLPSPQKSPLQQSWYLTGQTSHPP